MNKVLNLFSKFSHEFIFQTFQKQKKLSLARQTRTIFFTPKAKKKLVFC